MVQHRSYLDIIRNPSPRERLAIAATIAALAALGLILTSVLYGRELHPVWHDEFAYATQIQMLAGGRLWMPPHPVGEFFETFYVLHRPKYAALYFPGTAMLYAPSVWLGVPLWIAEAGVAGISVGLFYLVVSELLGGVPGLIGAFVLLSLKQFQLLAVMTMAQMPVLLFGLVMVWAYLRRRERRNTGWAMLIGASAGWAAITRPLDALCYAIPVGCAMLWELRHEQLTRQARTVGATVLTAIPFLGLQIAFNIGVTGSALTTPWQYYAERDVPGSEPGFQKFDPTRRVASDLPQKQLFYNRFVRPYLQSHDLAHLGTAFYERAKSLAQAGLPHWGLVGFVLLGLYHRDRRRWVLAGSALAFLLLYLAYPFTMTYYAVSAAPAMVVLLLSGVQVAAQYRPQHERTATRTLAVAVLLICLLSQPGVVRRLRAHHFDYLSVVDRALSTINEPAVVLFTSSPRHNIHAEPVFNYTVSWPDEARVIRAHDLRERNARIFRYYATHQPQRRFYRFDEETLALHYLGTATELANNRNAAGRAVERRTSAR